MVTKKSFKIKNEYGDNLSTDIRFDESKKHLPLVIFVHGFKGFKDWGGFPYMTDKLAEAMYLSDCQIHLDSLPKKIKEQSGIYKA